MREITDHIVNGLNEALIIRALDVIGPGNACHCYEIDQVGGAPNSGGVKTLLRFQLGPIKESGVNGISNEALLAIVIDRLRGFQGGEYSCKENSVALTHTETALLWLQKRTRERLARGVEGTSTK
jgi:hypothetical protein